MRFIEGDICKYSYIDDYSAAGYLNDSTAEYYESKNGKYCMVIGKSVHGFVPVFFLDEDVSDLMSGRYISAEVDQNSLTLVVRGKQ